MAAYCAATPTCAASSRATAPQPPHSLLTRDRFVPDAKKAVGGHVLAHASDTRIMLRKGKGDTRVGKITDSPWRAEQEAQYQITEGGINDVVE